MSDLEKIIKDNTTLDPKGRSIFDKRVHLRDQTGKLIAERPYKAHSKKGSETLYERPKGYFFSGNGELVDHPGKKNEPAEKKAPSEKSGIQNMAAPKPSAKPSAKPAEKDSKSSDK